MSSCLFRCSLAFLIVTSGARALASDPPKPLSHAECMQTGGVGEEAFSYFDEPASAWGGEQAERQLIRRASLRALVAFGLCPTEGEAVLSKHKDFKDRWISFLVAELGGPDAIYLTTAGAELPCQRDAPQLCSLKQKIEGTQIALKEVEGASENRGANLSKKITSDACAEFTDATGEILGATDNLAFVLAVFPDQFYAYMEAHPDVLEHWLSQARETLFRGMPESRDTLAEYKRQLTNRVSKYAPKDKHLAQTRDKVLEMLKSASVSAID